MHSQSITGLFSLNVGIPSPLDIAGRIVTLVVAVALLGVILLHQHHIAGASACFGLLVLFAAFLFLSCALYESGFKKPRRVVVKGDSDWRASYAKHYRQHRAA